MDILAFELQLISSAKIGHIIFENVALVKPASNSDLEKLVSGDDVLVVPSELKKSAIKSGKYLIFTCVCGVADDGGWTGVNVRHDNHFIHWDFMSAEERIMLQFSKQEYQNAVGSLFEKIDTLTSCITLEPKQVVFPEIW